MIYSKKYVTKSMNGKVRRESDARLIDQDSIEPGKKKKMFRYLLVLY